MEWYALVARATAKPGQESSEAKRPGVPTQWVYHSLGGFLETRRGRLVILSRSEESACPAAQRFFAAAQNDKFHVPCSIPKPYY